MRKYAPFSFVVPQFSLRFQPLFVQPQLFFLCPLPRNHRVILAFHQSLAKCYLFSDKRRHCPTLKKTLKIRKKRAAGNRIETNFFVFFSDDGIYEIYVCLPFLRMQLCYLEWQVSFLFLKDYLNQRKNSVCLK